MKVWMRWVGILLLVLVVTGCSAGGGSSSSSGLSSADEAAIRAALDKFAAGVRSMNLLPTIDIFASQLTVIIPGEDPETYSRSDLIDLFQDAFEHYDAVHDAYFTILSISGSGSHAIVDALWFIDSTVDGYRDSDEVRQEWRFRKEDGTWKVYRIENKGPQ